MNLFRESMANPDNLLPRGGYKAKVSLLLEHGSLLLMHGIIQTYWQHCLPPTKTVTQARINLTFRSIADAEQ